MLSLFCCCGCCCCVALTLVVTGVPNVGSASGLKLPDNANPLTMMANRDSWDFEYDCEYDLSTASH